MNIQTILNQLDYLFSGQQIDAVEPYLKEQLQLAYEEQDYSVCITIMNELIGFFRDTSQYEKSLEYCSQVLQLMKQLEYEGTLPFATTCLNVANALRAAGHLGESLQFYESIFPIYQKELPANDERIAALYNNLSLLYQEMGEFDKAVIALENALEVVEQGEDEIKIAITHSNLGASLVQLGKVSDALEHLYQAMSVFQKSAEKDFHYNAALAAMGQAFVMQDKLEEARECYTEALLEQMKHCGKSEAFYRILDNLHTVESKLGISLTEEPEDFFRNGNATSDSEKGRISGLQLSREFYEKTAKKLMFEAFPELIDRVAIGLVGEGSECYGFDDTYSEDHDFGPGFCIWVNKEDYEFYGEKLKAFYENLPSTFMGYSRNIVNGSGRVGVWCVDDFFSNYIGCSSADNLPQNLLSIPDEALSVVFNGEIFYDPSGIFTNRRNEIYQAFNDRIWQMKLAACLIELGKYGQYNYPRSMKRGDYVTAQMILYKYIEGLLKLVHFANHEFPPYYKWLKKSAAKQSKLAVLADLTEALADFADGRAAWEEDNSGASDKIVGFVEIIAGVIIDELSKDGTFRDLDIPKEELFLEAYGKALHQKAMRFKSRPLAPLSDENYLKNNSFDELLNYMVSLEWQAFDEVQNQGGRADCQDDWNTFSIMRKSQYMTWTRELIISFIEDFKTANSIGRNLITEKYARMMKSTDPEAYEKIKDKLPALTDKQQGLIEQIIQVQVTWMEEFAAKYPYMAGNSRSIHTAEDHLYNTSYETYLRGELSTYSHETLKQYGSFIVQLAKSGQNLARMTMENTAKLYGYASLDDAEMCLSKY